MIAVRYGEDSEKDRKHKQSRDARMCMEARGCEGVVVVMSCEVESPTAG